MIVSELFNSYFYLTSRVIQIKNQRYRLIGVKTGLKKM